MTGRSWTGQASALTWHYDFLATGSGNRKELHLQLFPDNSTGGNAPYGEGRDDGFRIVIFGEWEMREFAAVLLDIVLKMTEEGMSPMEVYRTTRRLVEDRHRS